MQRNQSSRGAQDGNQSSLYEKLKKYQQEMQIMPLDTFSSADRQYKYVIYDRRHEQALKKFTENNMQGNINYQWNEGKSAQFLID